MPAIRAATQLIRPYTTLLTFLSLLLPVFARSHDLTLSTLRAAPLLFVSMCTFMLNDLDDVDKDRVNHPDRPLPRGLIAATSVVTVYYVVLALALFTIHFGIADSRASFLYYALLTLAISYGYIVEYLPAVKAPYVAAVSTIPPLILATFYPRERDLYYVAVALFAFMLGRELCKDVLDRAGDPRSWLHKFQANRVAAVAFGLELTGMLLVSLCSTRMLDVIVCISMLLLLILAYLAWFVRHKRLAATHLMKMVLYVGLYFLISPRTL